MNIVIKSLRQARDYIVAHRATFIAVFVVMVFASVSMAQGGGGGGGGGVNVNLDLSQFWNGFNSFFNALFPPFAFIASISAAIGFIFMIVNALVRAFQSRFGGGR